MGRLQHATEPSENRPQPSPAPAQPQGALVAPITRGAAHLALDVAEQVRGRVAIQEQAKGLVQATPVEVRVQITQTRRQAAAHLPVGRRVLAAGQPAPAVTKPKQRIELLDQLASQTRTAQRADVDRVPGGRLAAYLEDRKSDVEPTPDVDQAVVEAIEADVAGRAKLLDQAVFEHQRAELRSG